MRDRESDHHIRQSGFTLVEMLVALFIFAMLALSGVTVLRTAASGQARTRVHLADQALLLRSQRLMEQDLAQVVLRLARNRTGASAPAFFGRVAQDTLPIMEFVRGGVSNPNADPRPDLQRVEYWFHEGGRLERRTYPQLDGAVAGEFVLLLDKVSALDMAYRNVRGDWLPSWDHQDALILPSAVRLTIVRHDSAPLTMMFRISPVSYGVTSGSRAR